MMCPSCGNPLAAELEAAEAACLERLANANLTPEEYALVATVGLAAVEHARKEVDRAIAEFKALEAEARYYEACERDTKMD